MKNLNINERIYGVSLLWKEAEYNFAHWDKLNDLAWDDVYKEYVDLAIKAESFLEYYKLLKSMYARLRDGHTCVWLTDEGNLDVFAPKLCMDNIGEDVFITNSLDDDNKWLIGSKIIEIDGVSTKEHLEKNMFPYISSSTNHYLWAKGCRASLFSYKAEDVFVKILKSDNSIENILLKREILNELEKQVIKDEKRLDIKFKKLENDIHYVKINSFMDANIVSDFKDYINNLNDCNGLILDVRKNLGGSSNIAMDIIRILTKKPFKESKWRSQKYVPALKSWDIDYKDWEEGEFDLIKPIDCKKYDMKIVVLIDNLTFSAAEDFLIALDYNNLAVFVGEKTSGSSGNSIYVDLPGGMYAQICSMIDLYPDNREFVGSGISPHICVDKTLDEILGKEDLTLRKALEVVNN